MLSEIDKNTLRACFVTTLCISKQSMPSKGYGVAFCRSIRTDPELERRLLVADASPRKDNEYYFAEVILDYMLENNKISL